MVFFCLLRDIHILIIQKALKSIFNIGIIKERRKIIKQKENVILEKILKDYESKKYTLKNDAMFKILFSINKKYLQDLLGALFKKSVKIKQIISEVNVQEESVEAKTGRLDLVVILQDDTIVNLEMQVRNSDDIISRMTLYNSRLVSQQLKSGSTYEKLKSTISIVFLDYEVPEFAGMMNPIHETIEVFKEDRNRKANKGLQVKYYIELPKCRHIEMDMEEGINQWLAFIDYKDRRLVEMAIAKNTVIREAQSEINRIKKNDNYSRFLDSKFKEEYERACDEYNKARYEKEKAKYEQNKVKYEQNMAKYEQNMAKYEQDKAKYEQNMAKYEQDKAKYEQNMAKYEQEKANFENEKELSKRENANLKKEVTKSQKEISKLEKEVDKSHKLGIEEGISEGYSRAEKMKNMQFVESLFSNGFKKEEIVKLAKLSANEVDEILLGLTA